ncbi:2-succinyl-5-enolpyruvyl-6-hydroxy-3-cyclohexene-1-carboxylic-acid synthase [Cerasicoccus arenae]|uniref:2-succinyl-5-enolpyruvyl-6-hydroxy-3-cyclohexene-1-carboxylate synthase n=1 Tax=Cerasicoccus arenae TaxID=424488 RepID=A0A8J3D9K8_9BACT|nr:2-succinyl-5-enolpyruvyl-6-hydroxy-3-cyclohexene-1-carboxylic-acid synthase [Cerasicoccus arenae]GHB93874.1 2-succinyl-5-enolpyruvyl-6-hydroxy-3-cyclohexene-1-carboxylate synthase [Cerasicoccus arenae]
MHPLLRANRNTVWSGLIVEALVRCGLRRAIISPGSRSTPLTLAFALDDRIESTPILDERSASFFALGCAKASGEPVALVCTSGTAAANYLPAVIEAHYSGAPLIVLTADRPAELRDCAAGQAIDQVKLYGDYAHFYHELALPPVSKQLCDRHQYLVRIITHANAVATTLEPGPVHINIPFREPLAPVEGAIGGPFPTIDFKRLPLAAPVAMVETTVNAEALPFAERDDLLVVVGPPETHWTEADRGAIVQLCTARGWPLLADTASGLRGLGGEGNTLIAAYDAILRDPVQRANLRPGALLFIGQLPTSKTLRSFLRECGLKPSWRLSTGKQNLNATYAPAPIIPLRPAQIVSAETPATPTPLTEQWQAAENAQQRKFKQAFRDCAHRFEGKLSRVLANVLPARTPIFVASSMPIRDVEFFWPVNAKGHAFVVNRGANGIDGTLSTALGMAQAAKRPGVLITGDLAFLHDQNGLLTAPEFTGSLTVFLVNNHGGGIFEKLEISEFEPPFERFFATPQNVDFAQLAAAHGLEYHAPKDWDTVKALARKLPKQGIRIIEIVTDRKADMAQRQTLLDPS